MKVDFVPVAQIGDLAEHKVGIDRHWEKVKAIKAAGCKTPADHPDLDPPHEVLLVREHLTESGRLEIADDKPEYFRVMLTQSQTDARQLKTILSAQPVDTAAANAAFTAVGQSCISCHKAYRD